MTAIIKAIAMSAFLFSTAWANYSVAIIEPAHSRAYQRPAQSIDIALTVHKKEPTDTLVVSLNGEFLAANKTNLSIPTADLTPNEYTIRAEIQDETGRVVASDSQTVYVLQNTHAIQLKRAEETKKQAKAQFDALPWYKRAYYHLRQDVQTPR